MVGYYSGVLLHMRMTYMNKMGFLPVRCLPDLRSFYKATSELVSPHFLLLLCIRQL